MFEKVKNNLTLNLSRTLKSLIKTSLVTILISLGFVSVSIGHDKTTTFTHDSWEITYEGSLINIVFDGEKNSKEGGTTPQLDLIFNSDVKITKIKYQKAGLAKNTYSKSDNYLYFAVNGSSLKYAAKTNKNGNTLETDDHFYYDLSNSTTSATNARVAASGHRFAFAFGKTSNPLPVTFLKFAGEKNNYNVDLTWSTASEVENKSFIIEASTDGHEFVSVGETAGAGTTNTVSEYSYTVLNPASNALFYRLRQVDYDGKSEVSNVIVVSEVKGEEQYSIYPNPCLNNNLYLSYSNIDENGVVVTIYDMNDKIHFSETFDLLGSGNIHLNNYSFLTQGVYYVNVKTLKENSTIKLVVE